LVVDHGPADEYCWPSSCQAKASRDNCSKPIDRQPNSITKLRNSSVVEPVAHLQGDHSGLSKMGAAKSVADVNKVLFVGKVCGSEFCRKVLPKRLPHRQVKHMGTGKMGRAILAQET
jgi:hypothetical protein